MIFQNGCLAEHHLFMQQSRKNAESHYPELGIERVGTGWKMPADRDKRVKALDQLLKGLAATGLDKSKIGTAY